LRGELQLLSQRFLCVTCQAIRRRDNTKIRTTFNSYDPEVMKQYPPIIIVREAMPIIFVNTKGAKFTKEMYEHNIVIQRSQRVPALAVANHFNIIYKNLYYFRAYTAWLRSVVELKRD